MNLVSTLGLPIPGHVVETAIATVVARHPGEAEATFSGDPSTDRLKLPAPWTAATLAAHRALLENEHQALITPPPCSRLHRWFYNRPLLIDRLFVVSLVVNGLMTISGVLVLNGTHHFSEAALIGFGTGLMLLHPLGYFRFARWAIFNLSAPAQSRIATLKKKLNLLEPSRPTPTQVSAWQRHATIEQYARGCMHRDVGMLVGDAQTLDRQVQRLDQAQEAAAYQAGLNSLGAPLPVPA